MMNKTKPSPAINFEITNQLDWLFPLIESLVQSLGGLSGYAIEKDEHKGLIEFLCTSKKTQVQQFLNTSDLEEKQRLTAELMHAGAIYIEQSERFRQRKKALKLKQFYEECRVQNVPLELVKEVPADELQPPDCSALHDWPDRRQPANGISGRLENAGQFLQRLFEEKRYDSEVYGELFMSDLKHINPQLYQSLAKWQSRTGNKILKTKRQEIDKLLETAEETELTFHQASQVRNARWRRKSQAPDTKQIVNKKD